MIVKIDPKLFSIQLDRTMIMMTVITDYKPPKMLWSKELTITIDGESHAHRVYPVFEI